MTKLTYALCILICAGLFAACGGSGNRTPEMRIMPNMPPMVDRMIPDRNLAVGRSADLDLVTPMRAFRDPEDAVLTYAAESSMPAVVTASTSGNQLTITSVGPTGASDITVTATDPGGLSATQTFTVNVVTNTAPMAAGTIPPLPISTGASQGISMSLYFTDRENDALTYGATSSDNAVATVRASGIGVVVAAVGAGTADITVTASDPDRLSAMQMFTVTVTASPGGSGPMVTPPPISTQTFNTNSPRNIDLSARFSGGRGTLTYTATSLDSNIATASVEGSVLTIQPVAAGRTSITATATDADMNSASQAFDVVVSLASPPQPGPQPTPPTNPNPQPPTVRPPTTVGSIPNILFLETNPQSVIIDIISYFSDPQGATLTYSAAVQGSVIRTSISGSRLTIMQLGTGEVTITVTAANSSSPNLSVTQTFMARATGITDLSGDIQVSNYRILDNYLYALMYGSFPSSFGRDVIRVNLSPGRTYQIDMEGLDSNVGTLADPQLALYLWDTNDEIIFDDDSGQGRNARLRYTPPNRSVPVSYALRMWGSRGVYRLRITSP
ncbi:MAG: hypothetical protein OXU92_02890 [Deltaproteobacteria bacterium]|nr:hypothetical protein [Deltaproteobacteria bacterium]